jgi:hypothetical protein
MKKTFEITIPTDWSEISIKKFMRYNNAVNELEDQHQIIVKTISTLCDIDESVVEVMKLSDLQKIQGSLQKLIGKPINKEIINKINIEGTMYGFHPKIDEITMGEFVDIETFAKDNDMAKLMSVFYRPITKTQGNRYDIEPYDIDMHGKNADKFENLSINIGNAVAVFFWNLGSEQLHNFHQSSEKEANHQHHQVMDGLV